MKLDSILFDDKPVETVYNIITDNLSKIMAPFINSATKEKNHIFCSDGQTKMKLLFFHNLC
jgi:hypothetical protein